MTLKEILNADHDALFQWAMHGWRWWIEELMTLVPPEWRERFAQRNSIVAEMAGDKITYRNEKTAQTLPSKPRGRIKLLMPADRVLVREIDLPVLPASDMKRMIALDIDRLTPFRADQVVFDAEIISRDTETGRQRVLMGILPKKLAAATIERARSLGIEPSGVGIARTNGGGRSSIDFLPALREAEGGTGSRRRAIYWWAAAGVLLVFNIVLFNYRGADALDQLRTAVESQQAPVTVAMRLRDKVTKEAARRTDLLKEKAQMSPLRVLDAVTRALPNGVWVQRFEWNGKTVHIRGFNKGTPDLLARLESPVLHNAHSLTSDPRQVNQANAVFDLAIDRRVERKR